MTWVWAFTDNRDFKGLKPFVDGLELQPDHFVDRLGQLRQSNGLVCIRGLFDLSEEVLGLLEAHMPKVDTLGEREILNRVRYNTTR